MWDTASGPCPSIAISSHVQLSLVSSGHGGSVEARLYFHRNTGNVIQPPRNVAELNFVAGCLNHFSIAQLPELLRILRMTGYDRGLKFKMQNKQKTTDTVTPANN